MAKKVIEDRRAWGKLTGFWNGRDSVPEDKRCGDPVIGPGGSRGGDCVLDEDHKNGDKHAANIPHADKDGHTGRLSTNWRDNVPRSYME
jgi:hypothetical protein